MEFPDQSPRPSVLSTFIGAAVLAAPAILHAQEHGVEDRWREILGPPQARIPAAPEEVVWHTDLARARALARDSGRPMFVTMRCLPCKQCSQFDQDVLEGGPALTPLLRQFVTVRLTDAAQLDFDLLQPSGFQDFDLSWWGWFLSPAGRIYGVFGGRDEVSDATRISPAALAATMRRVLAHHYDRRRQTWNADGPAPTGVAALPQQLPGFAAWSSRYGPPRDCLHCHQIAEVLRQPAIDSGAFDKDRDLEIWPLPENVGIHLDRDDGLLVTAVDAGSPAAHAGLRAGDRLAAAGGRRLFGQTDFRGVLHRAARTARIPVYWTRDDGVHRGELVVDGTWKRTVLDWRMSVSQGNIGAYPGFWPNAASAADRQRLGLAADRMAIRPWFGRNHDDTPSFRAGLRPSHVVTAVDGASPNLSGRAFLVWLHLRKERGDEVVLTVRAANGDAESIRFRLPE